MRPTQPSPDPHHSQDAKNAKATKDGKGSDGFMKRVRSSRSGRVVLALAVVGVLAAGLMVVTGRATALGLKWQQALTGIFAHNGNTHAGRTAGPQTTSAPMPELMAPLAQTIGSYPSFTGGFEDEAAGTPTTVSSIATGTQQTVWTVQNGSGTATINSTGGRSGPQYATFSATAARRLQSPTAASQSIVNSTSYIVQFYYKSTAVPANFGVQVSTDGTGAPTTTPTALANTSGVWTKVTQAVITPGTALPNPAYGIMTLRFSAASTNSADFDDVVLYPGSVADTTATGAPTSPTIGTPTTTSLPVSWTAPAGGVDGGGYLVVRGTSDPTTAPNTNGIYKTSNTVASGQTVVFIGTATSFTDTGLTQGTQYFYRIYAVDKAFNYSSAATTNGTTAAPTVTVIGGPLSFPSTNVASASAEQTYTVSGSNLTANLVVTAPSTDFQVSTTSGSGFVPSVSLTPSSGTVATTTIYVRFTPQTAGPKSGNITNASTGATTQNVAVSGNGSLSGPINVGTGEAYTSLTNAGGVFQAINAGGLSGNLIINITSDLAVESGTFALDQWTESGAGNYTLTIKPSGAPHAITGTATAISVIKLNGADRVTFDGSLSGGTDRSMTISSTNATSPDSEVILVGSLGPGAGATNDTIKNCVVRHADQGTFSPARTNIGISVFAASRSGGGADNDNLTIQNNQFLRSRSGVSAVGTTGNPIHNLVIQGNTFGDAAVDANTLGARGLEVGSATGTTITGNTIQNVNSTGFLPIGMYLFSGFVNASVTRNNITNIRYTGADPVSGNGIVISSGSSANLLIANNVISDIKGNGASPPGTGNNIGIAIFSGGGIKLYDNSVFLGSGSFAGASIGTNSEALLVGGTVTDLDVRGNIFANNLDNTGAVGDKAYAIYSQAPASAFTNIDNNDYFASGPAGVLGFIGGSDQTTITAWRTATGQDNASIGADPQFASATDLHITRTSPAVLSPVENAGVTLAGVTIDYDGDTRDASTPEIGADEVTSVQFSSATYSVAENVGGGLVTITVTRTAGSFNAATINYATGNNTATGGATCSGSNDYVNASGSLNFAAGDTSKTFDITICPDTTFENNETINLSLNTPAGSILGTPDAAVLTITNDDTAPTFAIDDVSHNEGNGGINGTSYTFTVTKTGSTALTATVSYATADDSATQPGDYTQITTTVLSFLPADTTKQLTVFVNGDSTPEIAEQFFVNLTSPTNSSISDSQGIGTITNDDLNLISGTKTVCPSGCDYDSLTNAGGLFRALNLATFTGDVTALITADLTNEGGIYHLNQWLESGVGNYTLTIKPSGAPRAVTGIPSALPHVIHLSGADRVTIDGSLSGGTDRSLTITSTSTAINSDVVLVESLAAGSSADNVTIKNCVLRGAAIPASPSSNVYGILSETMGGPSFGNDNLTIQNNLIVRASDGIVIRASSGDTANNLVIQGNTIGDAAADTNTVSRFGMFLQQTDNASISDNTIQNLRASDTTPHGFWATTGFKNSSILRNTITGIRYTGPNPASGTGMRIQTSITNANVIIANNSITDIAGMGSFAPPVGTAIGLSLSGAQSGFKVYDNSINLGVGSFAGAANGTKSIALHVHTTTDIDLRGNIFANDQDNTGAVGDKSYAIYVEFVASPFTTIDNNDYFASGPAGVLGFIGGSDKTTLTAWRTATGQDNNSIVADPQFASATDLHITRTSPGVLSPVENAGVTLAGVTTDYEGDTRDASTPEIGADEVTSMQFSSATYSVAENVVGGLVTITVTRTAGSANAATIHYATSDGAGLGGATCGGSTDYVNASGTLSFAAGDTSKTFDVTICNDSTYEGDEDFNVALDSPGGGSILGSPDSAVVNITEDDALPSFSIDDVSHNEGNAGTTSYVFTVTKTGATALNAEVSFTTVNGSATLADNDYQLNANTLLFFPADTTKQITVLVNGDTTVEPDEAFTVNLNAPVDATISDADGTGTIVNEDVAGETAVAVSGGNLVVSDANGGNTADTITISLNGANVRINDPNNTLTAGAGATQIDANTVEVPLVSISGNIQVNTLGANDTLTLALAGGDFIPAGGLSYAGGTQTSVPGDKLVITGGSQGTVTYNYTNANDGGIVMSAYGTVSYTGLEPITNSGTAADVIFNLPAGPTSATLADDCTGGNTMSRLSGATFETTDFANPTGSLTINRGNPADTLAVNALPDLNSSLTLGTTANPFSTITFNGAITLAANKNLAGDASSTISLSGAASDLLTSGTGTISLKTSRNVMMAASSSLETVNGGITVEANQQAGPTAGNFNGIDIAAGALVRTTGSGNISLLGKGGADGASANHRGIRSVGTITSTSGAGGAGSVTLNGVGGPGISGNNGVDIVGGAIVSSVNGNVSVTGQGGAATGSSNFGVFLLGTGTVIQSTGTATVTLNGTGGAGVLGNSGVSVDLNAVVTSSVGDIQITGQGAGTSASNLGVIVSNGAAVSSTGAAKVTISGTGGSGGTTSLVGVNIQGVSGANHARVTSAGGDILITGVAGSGSSTANIGSLINSGGQVTATGAAGITINGTSGTGTSFNHGVYVDTFGTTGTSLSAVNGNISITGVSTDATGTEQDGVHFGDSQAAVPVSVTTTGTGTLAIIGTAGNTDPTSAGISLADDTTMSLTGVVNTFIADTMDIGSSAVTVNAGANAITLRQNTINKPIDLGGVDSATQLGLTDVELDRFTAATLNLGNTNSGAITVSANITRAAATVLNLTSGANIDIASGLLNSAGGNVTLVPNTNVFPSNSGVDVNSGAGTTALTSGKDLRIVVNNTTVDAGYTQLNIAGLINLNNANLSFIGSTYTPVGGETFIIVNNDLAEAISGTFNGLPEGATISNFLGSGFNATISYTGGSGNDAVITVANNAVYTWAPLLGSTDWQVPTNWTPVRVPAPTDILQVDGASTPAPLVTNVPTQTIAAFRMLNGADPTLNAAALGQPHTLTINGATAIDLSVPSGSVLTLAGANGLTINVASGSVATVNGQVIFQDGPHRIIGNDYIAVRFHFGSICTTAAGFTGNPFGTGGVGDGLADSVVFESGSKYFHRAGLSPFGTAGNASVAIFQSGNEANWLTSSGFQGSDRVYSTLIIGNSTTATSVSDTGAGDFQFETLIVNSSPTVNSSLSFDNSSGAGRILIQNGITSNGVGSGSLSDVILKAGTGGIVMDKQFGTITFDNDGNNTRGIAFESNGRVEFDTTLALSRRLLMGIAQPNSSILTVEGNITGGSNGYVIGAVRKNALNSGSFTFPVGTVDGYTPLDLANISGVLGSLTVQPRDGSQVVLNSSTSLQEHWRLTENGPGNITADLTFHYLQGDVSGNEANYRVVVVESGNATSFPADANHIVDTVNNTFTKLAVEDYSDWTVAEPAAPTAVKLTGFSATRYENGEVQLNWQSGYEVRNLGYNIYREQGGRRVAITPSLVAGSALLAGGQTQLTAGLMYSWVDKLSNQQSAINNQKSPATYWLEDVDLDGTRTLHGPIAIAECGMGNADCKKPRERSRLLGEISNQQSGVEISGKPAAITIPDSVNDEPDPMVMQRTIAGMPGLKISISRAGWYRITQPQVLAAGLNIADANGLQLYRDGRQVAFRLSNSTEQFGPTDYLEFYGEGLSSTTASAQTYYLVKLAEAGKRIEPKEKAVGPGDRVSPQGFAYTVERKERMIYFSSLLNGDKENFFGQVVSSSAAMSTMLVSHLDPMAQGAGSLPQLEVVLQGVTSQAHQVQVRINGTELGAMSFANTDHPSQTFTVPAGAVHEGNNTVELTAVGGAADTSLIDVLRLTYVRSYEADNNALAFNLSSRQTKRITGFTNDQIRVVDVSDPYNVLELTPDVSADGAGFAALIGVDREVRAPFSRPHELLAFADGDAQTVDAIHANEVSSWWSETAGADYLIVTTADLKASVEPLAQLRAAQGLAVKIIDVEDLYDENTFGEHSPQAVRDLLAKAAVDWTTKPRYVVFAGDASYDPKNYLGLGLSDLVPTKLIDTSLSETASDDWLADFNNDGMADFAIGRLPVKTSAEMNALVAKIVNYETAAPDSSRGALLVSDNGFEASSSVMQSLLPAGMSVVTINRSSADDGTIHNQIIAGINQGPRVVNYIGHGSNGVWTGASLLSSNDAPNLTNTNRLSVFTMMTCYNGYFQDAFNDSLSEALLKAPGGAVAVWASTTLTQPAGQNAIDQEFYRMLFGVQPATLGDAARGAKLVTGDADVRRTWTLFGDPAMRLR